MKGPVKAIGDFCIDCVGTVYETPLCHISDCPLWPYRLGCRPTNSKYTRRIKAAWASKPEAVAELAAQGKTLQDLLGSATRRPRQRKTGPAPTPDKGLGQKA